MESYALALSDLSSGELRIAVVDASQGSVTPVTFTVEGEETITVPAGDIEVYRVATTGGGGGTLYVRKEFPHVLVKQEPATQPIVLELKEIREPE